MTAASNTNALAVQVARLYYYQGLTTDAIAQELGLSRPKVSRLLTHARRAGLVEIRIHDPSAHPQALEGDLRSAYPFLTPHVVSVPPGSTEDVWLERVAQHTAQVLSNTLRPRHVVGLAWGNTLAAVSRALTPRSVPDLTFVQLNGSASPLDLMNGFVTDTLQRLARNYDARAYLFPVPTFFDDPHTKAAMWRERSVQHVLELQDRADVLLYSVGSTNARTPSHVYAGAYLDPADLEALQRDGVVGDIATVFFRADGTHANVPMNARASGPDLTLMTRVPHAICVVSGLGKVEALRAALRGRLMNTLVVDEPTARALLQEA
ncbi:sugar-binding transcriptional regulator [Deinococcus maricopensis]|uniref:Transcriptional regulator, DeoR family n=1 Tax=Deinococcus maricopensis (strain DSM 21211 / LMG 22137 / NRRL B-23946 / LB-34) TaxID=709986 RepID=E8U5J2_DEIML|nr:sugar-binding transcriptional regulator [Deinococcus maricopensis]ADV66331.1 transcriptional regulator, DeoR family [Deinococcus maricopensis DSM 21211]